MLKLIICYYSAIALCRLLQHTIETNDVRLQTIDVKGDPIINPSEGIRTRSRAKAMQGKSVNMLLPCYSTEFI